MDSSGENDASAILFQKWNITFNFLWFRALYIVARLSCAGRQTQCQNYLTHWRADFDPVCQPSQRYPSTLSVRVLPITEKRLCQGDAPASTNLIGHEMLLAPQLPRFKFIGACHYRFSSPDLGIGEHGLSSLLETMLSPSSWQLKSVHLGPILCSIMVMYEEGRGFNKPQSPVSFMPSWSAHQARYQEGSALGDRFSYSH